MKRFILTALCMLAVAGASAQKKLAATDSIIVAGLVKQPFVITSTQVQQQAVQDLGDIVIRNHAGEYKSTEKNVKAASLLPLMQAAVPNLSSPRLYSECYFVMEATDGYRVVFSWNEIFNTAVGKQLWLIVEANGKRWNELPDRMLLLCTADNNTGRRHVKSLSRIVLKRVGDE